MPDKDETAGTEIAIRKPAGTVTLPDKKGWTDRFEVRSETSSNVYVVARNVKSGRWGCSCPGYCIHRTCKHLTQGCGLPLSAIHGRDHMEAPEPKTETKGIEGGKKTLKS